MHYKKDIKRAYDMDYLTTSNLNDAYGVGAISKATFDVYKKKLDDRLAQKSFIK